MFLLHDPPSEFRDYRVTSLAYAPDGSKLAAGVGCRPRGRGGPRGFVLRWNAPFDGPPEVIHDCRNFVRAVAYSPCGEWFAHGSGDGSLYVRSRSTDETRRFRGHSRPVVTLAFGPDGLLSGSADTYTNRGGGEAFHLRTDDLGPELFIVDGVGTTDGSGATAAVWSTSDPELVAVAQMSRVELHRLGRRGLCKLVTTTQPVSLDFSPDGGLLAAAMGWTVRTWRLDGDGRPAVRDLKGHDQRVNGVAFHPHEPLLASVGTDGTVRLWDCAAAGRTPDASDDQRAAAGRTPDVGFARPPAPESIPEIARYDWGLGAVRCIAFHPDGLTAAVGGAGIVVFDVE